MTQAVHFLQGRSTLGTAQQDVLAIVPWLLIPYDSLTHLLGVSPGEISQTLPATAIFSVIYLGIRSSNLRFSDRSRSVCATMAKAGIVIAIITLANIALEQMGAVRADLPLVRVSVTVRQALSMVLGLSSLMMFQDSMLRQGLPASMRWLIIGAIPSLIFAAVQIVSGDFRVQGLSSEPSQAADMLVFAVLPACAIAGMSRQFRWSTAIMAIAALLRTFSTTGFLKAVLTAFLYFIATRQLARAILFAGLLCALVLLALSWFPDNYAILVFSYMREHYERTGQLATGSFIDRFYGLIGPISLVTQPHGWLGYGFGGDTVYFDQLFSEETADVIRSEKAGLPSISSLQGKMLMYGGVGGYAVYLSAWIQAWRGARARKMPGAMLIAVFLSSLFSLGPIFLPYSWLWLAAASTAEAPPFTDRHAQAA